MTEEVRPIKLFADGNRIGDGLRIRIRGCTTMNLMPNAYFIDVYNLDNREYRQVKNSKIIYATGEDNTLIAYGELEDMYLHPSDPTDLITTLTVSDGKTFWETSVNRTIGANVMTKDVIDNLLGEGILSCYNAVNLQITRGQTYYGHLPRIISILAKSVNARAYFMNGHVFLTERGKAVQSFTLTEDVLDEDKTIEYANGIIVARTIVKGFSVGCVYLYSNNNYRLVSQKIDADSMTGFWRTELTLVDEKLIDAYGMGGG